MPTYISILRGINVGGKMIKMDALRKLYSELGFIAVQSYIQSGNVIFQSRKSTVSDLEKKIREGIKSTFKMEVPVMVLEPAEVSTVIKANPFLKRGLDVSKLHVTFLSGQPVKDTLVKIEPDKYLPDEFIIKDKAVYLYCPNGYGKTKLHNAFLENKLKVTATTRNWKTTLELLSIAGTLT